MAVSSKQGHWDVGTPLFSPPLEAHGFTQAASASSWASGLAGGPHVGPASGPASAAASGSVAAALPYQRDMLSEAVFKTSAFAVNTLQNANAKIGEESHFPPTFSFPLPQAIEGNQTNAAQASAANSGWVLAPQFFPTPPLNATQQVPLAPQRAQTRLSTAAFQSHLQAPTVGQSSNTQNATQASPAAAGAGRPLVVAQPSFVGEQQIRQQEVRHNSPPAAAAAASQPFITTLGVVGSQHPSRASGAALPSQVLGMSLAQLQEIEKIFNAAATSRSSVPLFFDGTAVQTQDWLFQTLAIGLHAELNALAAKIKSQPAGLSVTPALQGANKDPEQAKKFFVKNLRGIYEQAIVRGISRNLTTLYSNLLTSGAEKSAEAFYAKAKSGKGALVDVMSDEQFHRTYCFFLSDPQVIKMAFPAALDGMAPVIDLLAYLTKWSDQLKRPLPIRLQVVLSITPSYTEL